MTALPSMSPLRTAAEELLAFGYRIVPITPRQKAPGEFIAGRWRGMDTWQRWRDKAPTSFELKQWQRWPDANIGIVLGSQAGDGMIVIALDLDIKDNKIVADIVAKLPSTPMSKRGAKGETLFFRASPEIKTRAYNRPLDEFDANGRRKQERLADMLTGNHTRQTVVPPSAHPDGFAYEWLRGPVHVSELPVFDDAAMKTFESAMRALGWDQVQGNAPDGIKRATPKPAAPKASAEVVDMPTNLNKRLNAAALADLDAWVPELDLYKCQKARSGYEAVATWRPSSTGQPDEKRKRNLSIQPNGIQDFGAAQNYSPLDLIMCARGLSFNQAYDWLRGHIAPTDDTGVVLAFELRPGASDTPGAEDAQAGDPDALTDEQKDAIPPAAKPPSLTPAYFDSDLDLTEWPDELCFPVGAVGLTAKWIETTATKPCPILAYGAALVLVGTVAGRQFRGPTGTGTHLYVVGAAPTGVGKDHPMNCVAVALHDSGMSTLVGPPDYTADSAVMRHLLDQPLSVSVMDEFGSFWKRISSRRAGNWETAITRAFREAWGRSFALMRTKQYAGAGANSADVWWPALSIIGMTTPGEFFNALSSADVENGMANRLLVLATARRTSDRRTREQMKAAYFSGSQAHLTFPPHLVQSLKNIRDWQSDIIGPQFAWAADKRPAVPTVDCGISEEAKELLFSYNQWILDKSVEDENFGKFYSRGAESAQRIALIHAIGRQCVPGGDRSKPPRIDYKDVEHAVRLVDWSLRMLWARVTEHEKPDNLREIVKAVYRAISRRGGVKVPRTDVRRSLHGVSKRDLSDAIEELEDAKYISIQETKENPKAKKTTTSYTVLGKRPDWA